MDFSSFKSIKPDIMTILSGNPLIVAVRIGINDLEPKLLVYVVDDNENAVRDYLPQQSVINVNDVKFIRASTLVTPELESGRHRLCSSSPPICTGAEPSHHNIASMSFF